MRVVEDRNQSKAYDGEDPHDDDDAHLQERLMEVVDKFPLVLDILQVGQIHCILVEEVVDKFPLVLDILQVGRIHCTQVEEVVDNMHPVLDIPVVHFDDDGDDDVD